MFALFVLMLASPLLIGALIGVAVWRRQRRTQPPIDSGVRWAVGLAAALLLILMVAQILRAVLPPSAVQVLAPLINWRFLTPLLVGCLALMVLLFPVTIRRGGGSAELDRRTPFSFASRGTLWTLAVLIALSLGLAAFGGALSRPDDLGQYRMIWIELGSTSGGTEIYGWYYSVPALWVLGALIVLVAANLVLISSPPISADVDGDRATRRFRIRAVLRLASSAIALHVAAVLVFLAGTSTASVTKGAGGVEAISVGTSFAALTPVLWGAWALASCLGAALCMSVLLSAVSVPLQAPRRVPVAA
ncbi:MAG: hypothetical protein P0Y60_04435 [Candidatus Microbacterium colombiense]|nr:MAG: hypothetical protein P0Y60_04435 [Microbacterium sp.]